SPLVSHCIYTFSCDVFSDCLDHKDHDRLEEHAQRLEAYTRPAQVGWGSFFCDWARHLSAWQRGRKTEATRAHLLELAQHAQENGWYSRAGRINRALGS